MCLTSMGQNFYLKLTGTTENETKLIDSLGYVTKVSSTLKIGEEVTALTEKIQKLGFIENRVSEPIKTNDSTYNYTFTLGRKIKYTHIYIGTKNKSFFENEPDTLKMKFSKTEEFLNSTIKKIESKGYSISKVRLKDVSIGIDILAANLDIELDQKRMINEIVINGYDKFPAGYKKNINRKYAKKVFNQESLEKISTDFKSIRFIKQIKYPEILFSPDSTKIFVYVEKKKNNSFDGFLGFSNSEEKLILNGYVDLNLSNVLNSGDLFSLKWRSDGQDQTNFNLGVELPFLFKSPLGLKVQLNIFKQDSTFQNSKTDLDLGYYLTNKSKLFVGYQSVESSDIQNSNTALLNDFTNNFITTSFEHVNLTDDFLFPEKTFFFLKLGMGKRDSKFNSNSQFLAQLNVSHILEFNSKNSLFLSSQNYYLQSETFLTNELFRFGGIKSIRGFRENSLQGNQVSVFISEYRYKFSPNLYAHSIVDYGYFKDNTTNLTNKPLGFGLGFGLLTNNGLLNFIYANGIDNKQIVKLSNSIIHISFKSFF